MGIRGPKALPFDERYIQEPMSGCWLWEGIVDKDGYGKLWHGRKSYRAHRFSWILHHGEIPLGMSVLHKCDTPPCVNPAHLFLGSRGKIPQRTPFETRYIVDLSGCWLWDEFTDKDGYGRLTINYKDCRAHRVSWELHRGEIPKGMWVLHKCDTPSCVNPDHLFLGTVKENADDRERKGRGALGDQEGQNNRSAKLTEANVLAIRADTRSQSAIIKDYGISSSQVFRIKNRQRWAHL
jgi:hypothetical protein